MTFAELIKSQSWLSIKLTLGKLFQDQSELLNDYEKVFYELQTMPDKESKITIDVNWIHDEFYKNNLVFL